MKARHHLYALTAITAGMLLAVPAFAANKSSDSDEPAKKIAEFRLKGEISEAPPPEMLFFGFDNERPTSLKDLLARLKKARKDAQVAGVLITMDGPMMGMAQMQELRKALLEIRAANKDVYCHLESVSGGLYMLASTATKLSVTPGGEISLMGIHAENAYFKGLLNKIHLEADMEHIGEYKAASEPLTRDRPTPEAEAQMNWLVDDLYAQLVESIAETRGLAPEKVKAIIDDGPYLADRALEAKLVDAVEYRQDFISAIKDKHGKTTKIVSNYGASTGPEIDFSSPFGFFEAIGRMMKGEPESTDKPVIAVVYVEGAIMEGPSQDGLFGSQTVGSSTLRRVLEKARDDTKVQAIVLRINSPGGSALASEIIWNAAKRCGEKKPLVVSMGNVAASGGYYIASAADTIFADAGTITGSIGVVGGKLITKGLWDWAGVNFHETQRGRNADLFSSSRKFDDRQRAIVRKQMEDVYKMFTARVRDGRGKRLADEMEKIARGRVYTGTIAKQKGLVDEIGGLEQAVAFAAKKANLTDYQIRVLPKTKNLMDLFRKSMGHDEDDASVNVRAASQQWPLATPAMQMLGPALRQIDPAHARLVVGFLMQLDMLHRESVLTVMPEAFLVNGMGW